MTAASTATTPYKRQRSRRPSSGRSGRAGAEGVIMKSKALFYRQAAEKTLNPIGKSMFFSMMQDEQRRRSCPFPGERGRSAPRACGIARQIKTFCEKSVGAMLRRVRPSTDEVEALEIAMEVEREILRLISRLSRRDLRPAERALVELLAREERRLYDVASNTRLFLSDPGGWFMRDEYGLADGGTPWA